MVRFKFLKINKFKIDETVESLLQLADKYDVACVKESCEKFLTSNSDKSRIFKFRMAETYGLVSLKVTN